MTDGPSPRSAWNATPAPCRLPALSPRNRSALFRGDLRCRDELRHPLLSPFKVLAVHRLELGRWEGVRRGALEQCRAPSLEPRKRLDMAELLHPVQEEVALQEWRVGGVHQRILGAVEEGATALLRERLLQPLERHRD